jgi:hypothetical protein
MSSELKPVSGDLVVADSDNPFTILPAELIPATAFFSARFSHLKLSPVGVCTDVAYWLSLGLSQRTIERILMRFCTPGVVKEFLWPNELMVRLNEIIDREIRIVKQLQDRKRYEEAEKNSVGAAAITLRLANAFRMPISE